MGQQAPTQAPTQSKSPSQPTQDGNVFAGPAYIPPASHNIQPNAIKPPTRQEIYNQNKPTVQGQSKSPLAQPRGYGKQ